VRRGEVYRTAEKVPERGGKPGFYVVVSRSFIAATDEIGTVVCAPIYSGVLGLDTEVIVGLEEGLPRTSSIRCDFLMLMFKSKLTGFVSTLTGPKLQELNRALAAALELPQPSFQGSSRFTRAHRRRSR
jgi:mRNA-degrading endonuclease toxin of MazEF toxin-antitoxin module